MDLLPLRAAAGGGSIDGHPAESLVAAGFTLLQRSAVLVRGLAGRRSAILLPASPQSLVALAASDGRGALFVSPLATADEVAELLQHAGVGAVFTASPLADRLPSGTVHVLLDEAPASATVVAASGAMSRVDLGSHFGLDLEGDATAAGREEECAIVLAADGSARRFESLTHRDLITLARRALQTAGWTPEDRVLVALPAPDPRGFTVAIAPLLAGARLRSAPGLDAAVLLERITAEGITALIGDTATFEGLLRLPVGDGRSDALASTTLRRCTAIGAARVPGLGSRWESRTGLPLHDADAQG